MNATATATATRSRPRADADRNASTAAIPRDVGRGAHSVTLRNCTTQDVCFCVAVDRPLSPRHRHLRTNRLGPFRSEVVSYPADQFAAPAAYVVGYRAAGRWSGARPGAEAPRHPAGVFASRRLVPGASYDLVGDGPDFRFVSR